MYLHLGGNGVVRTKDIIGIFDLDKTTVSASTRGYLAAKEKQKKVVTLGEGLPQSFVITANKKKEALYLSPISAGTLAKRKDITHEESLLLK
ncbi:MAG: DUF370 domain-containing protein [Clostridia bacterium]|nr:DUF370 domain-containing protein [Clostridia bacterium]